MLINALAGQLTLTLGGGDNGGFNPADATAFYFGLTYGGVLQADPVTSAPTVATVSIPSIRAAGTIREVYLSIVVGGTLGTTETGTGAIRVNNGTDTTVFNNTLQWNAISQTYSATGLSIALAVGDFFSFKITPPTWVTNPTVTFYGAQVVITYP